MKVFVKPHQFAWLQEAMLRVDITQNPTDIDHIMGQLCIFALSNGSIDFNPNVARVVSTEIEVIYD